MNPTTDLPNGQGVVSQFDVNHAQVTNGLDAAVGIKKGIIGMSNPRYAEAWKLLGQLVSYSASGESGYDGCADPNATSPPLSPPSASGSPVSSAGLSVRR